VQKLLLLEQQVFQLVHIEPQLQRVLQGQHRQVQYKQELLEQVLD
jgi:hypothetical protein